MNIFLQEILNKHFATETNLIQFINSTFNEDFFHRNIELIMDKKAHHFFVSLCSKNNEEELISNLHLINFYITKIVEIDKEHLKKRLLNPEAYFETILEMLICKLTHKNDCKVALDFKTTGNKDVDFLIEHLGTKFLCEVKSINQAIDDEKYDRHLLFFKFPSCEGTLRIYGYPSIEVLESLNSEIENSLNETGYFIKSNEEWDATLKQSKDINKRIEVVHHPGVKFSYRIQTILDKSNKKVKNIKPGSHVVLFFYLHPEANQGALINELRNVLEDKKYRKISGIRCFTIKNYGGAYDDLINKSEIWPLVFIENKLAETPLLEQHNNLFKDL